MEGKRQESLTISAGLKARLDAFFRVFEAVMGENINPNALPDLVVKRGLDALFTDALRGGQPEEYVVTKSLIAMSYANPDFVYGFFATTMHTGSGLGEWWAQLIGQQ